MDYTKDKDTKDLVVKAERLGLKIDSKRVVSKFSVGDCYRGIGLKNKGVKNRDTTVFIYLSRMEDYLFNDEWEVKSKSIGDDVKIIPLHKVVEILKTNTEEGYEILNSQLENGSKEINRRILGELYDTEKYNNLISGNKYKTVKSIEDKVTKIKEEIDAEGLNGEKLVDILYYLGNFYKLEGTNVLEIPTFYKVSDRVMQDVVPLKGMTEEELRNVGYGNIKYFKNKGVGSFTDLEEYIDLEVDRCIKKSKYLKDKPECNGEMYKDKELIQGTKDKIIKMYLEYINV